MRDGARGYSAGMQCLASERMVERPLVQDSSSTIFNANSSVASFCLRRMFCYPNLAPAHSHKNGYSTSFSHFSSLNKLTSLWFVMPMPSHHLVRRRSSRPKLIPRRLDSLTMLSAEPIGVRQGVRNLAHFSVAVRVNLWKTAQGLFHGRHGKVIRMRSRTCRIHVSKERC